MLVEIHTNVKVYDNDGNLLDAKDHQRLYDRIVKIHKSFKEDVAEIVKDETENKTDTSIEDYNRAMGIL